MSNPESEASDIEVPRSKVKVVRNAKGDAQWEVTVGEGATETLLNNLRAIAVAQYDALLKELG